MAGERDPDPVTLFFVGGKLICPKCAWVAGYNGEVVLSVKSEYDASRRCSRCHSRPASLRKRKEAG